MSKISELKVNVTMKPIQLRLSCLNCVKDNIVDLEEFDPNNESRVLNLGTIVFDEHRCEECGCNSFNTKLNYVTKIG